MKSGLAVVALATVGVGLRWVTAGSISAANVHDLDSLTALVVGAVAWIAYGWLVLAVVATALEQLPGALGRASGVLAGRITSTTSRALLRSALGVAAITPLTIGAAQATPYQPTHHATAPHPAPHQVPNPALRRTATHQAATHQTPLAERSAHQRTLHNPATRQADFRATEPQSASQIGGEPAGRPHAVRQANFLATEPPSSVDIGGVSSAGVEGAPRTRSDERAARGQSSAGTDRPRQARSGQHATPGQSSAGTDRPRQARSGEHAAQRQVSAGAGGPQAGSAVGRVGGREFRATEARSSVQPGVEWPAVGSGPRNGVRAGSGVPRTRESEPQQVGPTKGGWPTQQPGRTNPPVKEQAGRVRVPDRPEVGGGTRYMDLRAGRVRVKSGDTLWGLAARELGPRATEAEIAVRWPQWYAANRQVIGDDPDLILPGQVLRVPTNQQER